MAKKRKAYVRTKKARMTAPSRHTMSWRGDHVAVQPRTYRIARASIEKNREVLLELAKH